MMFNDSVTEVDYHAQRLAQAFIGNRRTPHSNLKVELPDWASIFWKPSDFKIRTGGRGAGKTITTALTLLIFGHQKPLRIAVVRRHRSALVESAQYALELNARNQGLVRSDAYTIKRQSIDHVNGTHIFWVSLSHTTEEDVRGIESADIVWVEEGHQIAKSSWELLKNTVRKEGSEIWVTLNPKNRDDPVYHDFVMRSNPRAIHQHITYRDNPWFPERAERDRADDEQWAPDRYAHVWLGEPESEVGSRSVLSWEGVQRCVALYRQLPAKFYADAPAQAGLDIADLGTAENVLCIRKGPLWSHCYRWRAPNLGETTRRAHRLCVEHGVVVLYYDVGGIGAGVRSFLAEFHKLPYAARPVLFGSPPWGGGRLYTRSITNAQFFDRVNAQMAWNLRRRTHYTERVLEGSWENAQQALAITPDILNDVVYNQLTQPVWEETLTGKIRLEKAPDHKASPDIFDALCLAFARDARYGLKG